MLKALITGSFDPPTLGHLDLIKRSARLFDETVVCIFVNSDKKYMFPLDKREKMLSAVCGGIANVRVDTYDGLVADYAREKGVNVIVKGARNGSDYEYETLISRVNRTVYEVETVILPSSPECEFISSTTAKEMIKYGGNLAAFLPEEVIKLI